MSEDWDADEELRLHFQDLGSAAKEEPEWVIKDMVPIGMTILAAPPKSYKSTVEMSLAILVAGHPCGVLPPTFTAPKPGRVLGFSYEATAGELRHMAEEDLGCTVPPDGSILIADDPWSFRLDDPEQIRKLLYWLDAAKPRLVFLDPLRDFHSMDENDSGAIIRALRPLQRWAKDNHAAVLVVHHTKKRDEGHNNANDLRGTSALFGMVDGCLVLTRKGEETVYVQATFKRGASWSRSIVLSAYARKGEASGEPLGELESAVLRLIAGKAGTLQDIASQLRVAKSRVVQAAELLERNGHIRKVKGKWVVP